jgi:hypothetical protein
MEKGKEQKEFNRVLAYKEEYVHKGLYSYETSRLKDHLYEKVMDFKRRNGVINEVHEVKLERTRVCR